MERCIIVLNKVVIQFRNKKDAIRIIMGLILIGFMGWIIYDTLMGAAWDSDENQVIEANVRKLKVMENQTPPDIKSSCTVSSGRTGQSQPGDNRQNQSDQSQYDQSQPDKSQPVDTGEDEQERIMTMEDPDISVFNQWFDGCAIVGDSLVEGAGYYGFLNSSILFSKIGCSVSGAGELVESMVQMHPRKVFLALGNNDMENYGSHVEKFIEKYRDLISGIRKSLPDSQIYVAAVLPVQQKAINKEAKMKNVELYNEYLEEMCEELKMTFLDPGFILKMDDSLYEPDGIHTVKKFYYKWLTYLADMAGVSQ